MATWPKLYFYLDFVFTFTLFQLYLYVTYILLTFLSTIHEFFALIGLPPDVANRGYE